MDERRGLGPAFKSLLTATFVTNLGDGLRLAAIPLLADRLTSSSFLISTVVAAQFLPWTTFAPFGGLIVDRSDRRRLIMITQAWRAALMLVLVAAVAADFVQLWHLCVVAYLITVGEILVDPSVVATVPTIVSPSNLDRANGQLTTVETVTNEFAGGPVGAGTFALAPWLPFLIDAITYFGSIAPFSRLPATPAVAAKPEERSRSVWAEMGDGLQWIRTHPFLRPATRSSAVFHLGTAGAFGLLIKIVSDTLEAPEYVFGIALAAAAAGATLASVVAARLTERFSRRTVITAAATVTALSVIAAGSVTSSWQLVVVWSINGAGGGILLSIGRGFVQRHTPNDILGRAAIATRMITRTSFVVGALIAGAIASATSLQLSYIVSGSFHLLGAFLYWRSFEHDVP